MQLWKSVVGKLWMTIMVLVAIVLLMLGFFLLQYIDTNFANSNDVKNLFIMTGIIGFLLTTFFAFFLSTRITAPLVQLKKAAVSISEGNYSTRVFIPSNDEIGQLSKTFNQMSQQMEETINALHHEKEHLGSVLRSMTDAVMTFDANGNMILVNPQGEKLVNAWHSITWEDESQVNNKQAIPEPLLPLFQSVVSETKEMISKLHVQNGVWSVVLTPLHSQGKIRGVVAVLRDVTEEHKLNKLRKDFVANVSHELRTPLSMLQGYSEALIDGIAESREESQELAQIINDESLRMGRLVDNFLDLAKMEAGHLDLNCDVVNLSELINRVVRKFSAFSKDEGIVLEQLLDNEHDLQITCGDEDRLEQVLTNLIDNAIRHTPAGASIIVRGKYVSQGQGRSVMIDVEDEGEGIPPEDMDYIFERFYKADKARTRGILGNNGLGLSIVKNIVESHKGTIEVNSILGHGTTFSLTIPCDRNEKM